MEIAVIGGGASALMLSNVCQENVTIFCDKEKLGKKILLTGNGKCNLTNNSYTKDCYNQDIQKYLDKFDYDDTLKFFYHLGLLTYSDENGRVYPVSNTATSVVDVLTYNLIGRDIDVKLNYHVQKIEKRGDKFIIDDVFYFDKVAICAGSSNELLDAMNIEYKPFVPSLVALKTTQDTKRLSGIRLSDVVVSINNKYELGEVLFKDNGLSGICIFNLSSYLARRNNFKQSLCIDLLPYFEVKDLEDVFFGRLNRNYPSMILFLQGIFHKEINKYLLKESKINEEEKPNKNNIKKLIKNIKSLKFDIISTYDNNQVKSGGIRLDDLDENLQHKKIKGLYFAGEICDVDGICGGYNLQWAWTSGKIVGENICLK